MKTLITLIFVIAFSSSALATNGYEAIATSGLPGSCESADIWASEMHVEQYKRMIATAYQAKENCQSETGKLCGIISIGTINRQSASGAYVCVAQAFAKPLDSKSK